MSNQERFEVLWNHYRNQIDENRAVYKTLDEMRNRIKELENALATRTGSTH